MKKIEYKSYVSRYATFGDYIVEIQTAFDNLHYDEIWIFHKNYGIKEMEIGITNMTQKEIDEIILDNIDNWIDGYKKMFEDKLSE